MVYFIGLLAWVIERINGVPGERTPDIHNGRIALRGERNVRIFTE